MEDQVKYMLDIVIPSFDDVEIEFCFIKLHTENSIIIQYWVEC